MRMRMYVGAAMVAMLVSVPARAAVIRYAPTGFAVPRNVDAAIRYELPRLIQQHANAFRRAAPRQFQITYFIFNTAAEYEAYARTVDHPRDLAKTAGFNNSTSLIDRETGLILSAEAQVVTWRQTQPQQLLSTVLHETTHAVTHAFLRQAPLWFMEGSAEWFEQPAWADSVYQRHKAAQHWLNLGRLLEQDRLPPLRRFLESNAYPQWETLFEGQMTLGYDVSFTLFSFFVEQPEFSRFLSQQLQNLELEPGSNPARAFAKELDHRWPGGIAQAEKGWRRLILNRARILKARQHPETRIEKPTPSFPGRTAGRSR